MKKAKGLNEGVLSGPGKGLAETHQSKKPHFHGHRNRLREKFRTKGAGSLAEYEILELLLFRSIPHTETTVFC